MHSLCRSWQIKHFLSKSLCCFMGRGKASLCPPEVGDPGVRISIKPFMAKT